MLFINANAQAVFPLDLHNFEVCLLRFDTHILLSVFELFDIMGSLNNLKKRKTDKIKTNLVIKL